MSLETTLFKLRKKGLVGLGRDLLFGKKKPEKIEVAGDKNELTMGWISNDALYYLIEDPLLGFAGNDNFGEAYDMYREMRIKWPHFRHLIKKRQNAVLSKNLTINARSKDNIDIEIAQFCRDMIEGISGFEGDLRELLECILFGFSVSEMMWDIVDGKWVVVELKNRKQERFRFSVDQYWGLDRSGTRTEFLPIEPNKFVIMQYDQEYEKPYGQGEGKYNYWYYYFQQNILKFWLIYTDKFASPTGIGKYPPGVGSEEKTALLDALKAFQTDQQIMIPENVEIALLEAQRQGSLNCYDNFVRYLELSASKNVLGGTLTSDEGKFGTRAQATVHQGAQEDIMESDCEMLSDVIRYQILKPAVLFNFGEGAKVPITKFDYEVAEDLEKKAKTDEILVTKLGVPLDNKYFYEAYQRPEPEGGSLKGEGGSLKGEGGSLKGEGGSLKGGDKSGEKKNGILRRQGYGGQADGGEEFTEEMTAKEAREIVGRWGMDEVRYGANSIDRGKRFYFGVMDWIMEGIKTAEDEFQVYNLNTDLAEAETQALASFLTSMIFTAQLNGMLEIKKMGDDAGVEFGEERSLKFEVGSLKEEKNGTYVTYQEIGEYQFYPLEPREAIEYFEGLVPLTREELENQLLEVRRVAFTVADIQRKDVIAKIQDRLTKALQEGQTFRNWQKGVNKIFDNEGISRKNPFRMRTIFQTNVHRALVAGRDRMSQGLVNRGILRRGMWQSVGDDRVRPEHQDYDGQVWDWNDARWEGLKDYGCRCQKVPVLGRV